MSSHADVKHLALDEFTRAESAALAVRMHLSQKPQLGSPEIAVVLGSGLGGFAAQLQDTVTIPYAEIPNFPRATAAGHAGHLLIGALGGLAIAVMQGRVHVYEGYSSREAAFPVRVLGRLGVKSLVLTNAAGGINPAYGQGSLVLIRDHINLQGSNPLHGPNDERFGPRFPDLTEAYSARYRRLAHDAAREPGIEVQEGASPPLPRRRPRWWRASLPTPVTPTRARWRPTATSTSPPSAPPSWRWWSPRTTTASGAACRRTRRASGRRLSGGAGSALRPPPSWSKRPAPACRTGSRSRSTGAYAGSTVAQRCSAARPRGWGVRRPA